LHISCRALGPAIGGSIGIMFTVANTISVGTYTIGFATSVSDLLQVSSGRKVVCLK
jgi:hypothetical protein